MIFENESRRSRNLGNESRRNVDRVNEILGCVKNEKLSRLDVIFEIESRRSGNLGNESRRNVDRVNESLRSCFSYIRKSEKW